MPQHVRVLAIACAVVLGAGACGGRAEHSSAGTADRALALHAALTGADAPAGFAATTRPKALLAAGALTPLTRDFAACLHVNARAVSLERTAAEGAEFEDAGGDTISTVVAVFPSRTEADTDFGVGAIKKAGHCLGTATGASLLANGSATAVGRVSGKTFAVNQIGGRAVVLDFSFSFTHAGQQSTANLEQVRAQYGRAELDAHVGRGYRRSAPTDGGALATDGDGDPAGSEGSLTPAPDSLCSPLCTESVHSTRSSAAVRVRAACSPGIAATRLASTSAPTATIASVTTGTVGCGTASIAAGEQLPEQRPVTMPIGTPTTTPMHDRDRRLPRDDGRQLPAGEAERLEQARARGGAAERTRRA